MIEIKQLQVTRDGKTICEVEHLMAKSGERLVVVGPNGSGKSTLLRVLAGLIVDYSGQCEVSAGSRERTYVHQQPILFRGSVLSNVRYGQQGRAGGGASAAQWLDRMGVGDLATRDSQNLSGGEIRRIALARALACEPKLLILDEPLAELDLLATGTVCEVLNQLPHTTIVIASPIEVPALLACQRFDLKKPAPSSTPSAH